MGAAAPGSTGDQSRNRKASFVSDPCMPPKTRHNPWEHELFRRCLITSEDLCSSRWVQAQRAWEPNSPGHALMHDKIIVKEAEYLRNCAQPPLLVIKFPTMAREGIKWSLPIELRYKIERR